MGLNIEKNVTQSLSLGLVIGTENEGLFPLSRSKLCAKLIKLAKIWNNFQRSELFVLHIAQMTKIEK